MRHAILPALALVVAASACSEVPSAPLDSGPEAGITPTAAFSAKASGLAGSDAPWVLVFRANRLPADVEAQVSAAGGTLLFSFPQVGIAVARADDPGFASKAGANRSVAAVGPAGRWQAPTMTPIAADLGGPTAADYYLPIQWDIRRVGADMAWSEGFTGSHNTVVAIIDQGIDATHPDLAGNVLYQACMDLAGPCSDAFRGGHGTHVAGTVAAAFGGGAIVGVGPDLGLAGYQVFETSGGAWDPPIWWAILDAADRGFRVINMSLGGYETFGRTNGDGAAIWTAWNRVVSHAVNAGVTVVASAGNGAISMNGTIYHVPGDLPGIINVAATGIRPAPLYPQAGALDVLTYYSNFGAAVTLSAPGGDCGVPDGCPGVPPSGYPYQYYLILSAYPGGYAFAAGTSQATPHVTGAAGLILDANPSLNPHQVAAILMRTADRIGSRQLFGQGMLDVLEAVRTAAK